MKDPDFEGCKFIPLPPDEERRELKKKRSSALLRLVLSVAGMLLVAGCLIWVNQRRGTEQDKNGSPFLSDYMERGRRSMDHVGCPELGPQLATIDSPIFDHMFRTPQCLDQVQPKLTLYTRNRPTQGCSLTPQDLSVGGNYYDIPTDCYDELYDLPKVVFLVHGLALFRSQLDEYMDMKKEILEAEETGVILVDWYEGAKVDLNFLENSTVASILTDFVNLEMYHQAAANTRYMGAALAVVTENIRNISQVNMKTHCIGHSLGAHTCGFLGKALNTISAPPLDRITGLDPAGPLFLESQIAAGIGVPSYSTSSHLAEEDALLVDTIHTDSTWLGAFTRTGHHDFYVGESKTNMDGRREDSFGYNQPGVKNCFMGSHLLAIDIFLATIPDEECIVEKVCTNINENITESCQEAVGVKFGYNVDGVSSFPGSYPVFSDKSSIRCAHGKTIKVTPNPAPALVEMLANIKFDFCSLISSILGPVREMSKVMADLLQESNKRLATLNVELEKRLAELLSSTRAANSARMSIEDELYDIYQEMQQIAILHQRKTNQLTKLATRTTKESKTIVGALNEIMTPANGKQAEVDIPFVLDRVRQLMDTSDKVLQEADQVMNEIAIRYGTISTKLVKLEGKANEAEAAAEEYDKDLEKGIKKTKEEQSTFWDLFRQAIALGNGCKGLFDIVTAVSSSLDLTQVPTSVLSLSTSASILVEEHIERGEEKSTIGLLEKVKNYTEELRKAYQKYSKEIGLARLDVKKRQEILAKRREIISKWKGVVEKIMANWGYDDYKKLQDHMSTGNNFMLKEAITDFQDLDFAAQAYLDYDQNSKNTIAIP